MNQLFAAVLPDLGTKISDKLDNIHDADIEMHSNSAVPPFYIIY